MTGQYATYGASHKAGAEIAMEELNAAGGVNGGEVSISIGDDLGDPKEAVLVAQKFIDDSELVVVDGHQFSGATIAAGRQVRARRPHHDHAVGHPAGHHRPWAPSSGASA